MQTSPRISSILQTIALSKAVTGFPTFHLSNLELDGDVDFELPTNVRLGHLAERVVSQLIQRSNNYELLRENIQLIEDKQTIGELDFILEDMESKDVIHLELAYKFYLYDPSLSEDEVGRWIGPNRNDSLGQKLGKLKTKQFPLLYHSVAKDILDELVVDSVKQQLCLLVSLFIPYQNNGSLGPEYINAVKGYYIDFVSFKELDTNNKQYYIPSRKEWGIEPDCNLVWNKFSVVSSTIIERLDEKQSVLCWQKQGEEYSQFFVIWWGRS